MRLRCMCLVIHAPDDLRVDAQDTAEPGPGEVLVAVGMAPSSLNPAEKTGEFRLYFAENMGKQPYLAV